MFLGITVDFRGGCEEHTCLDAFGESEHVDGSHGGCFDSFHGVVLVVWWGCGACEVVYLVHFEGNGFGDIVDHEAARQG